MSRQDALREALTCTTRTLETLSTAGLAEYRLKGSWAPIAAWQWDSHVQGSSAYVGIVKHWGTK